MDPGGPWYASYNRLAAGTAAGTFQAGGTTTGSDFVSSHHHLTPPTVTQTGPTTTASPLLLQAAHTSASLSGQPFNPGGFLSPPPVGYDVFSPLFPHPNAKQAHYATPHRQVVTQAQTVQSTVSKPTTTSESEQENYNTGHQTAFFDHQAQTTSPTASTLSWSHQGNSQLPSPFGILPHESVPASPGPPATKAASGIYENNFNSPYVAGQNLNNITTQLSSSTADFKSSSYPDRKKVSGSTSPTAINKSTASGGNGQPFFQQTPAPFAPDSLSSNYSAANPAATKLPHQSCIVSAQNNNATKDYRVPTTPARSVPTTIFANKDKNAAVVTQPSVQSVPTKAQSKVYPELSSHDHQRTEPSLESSQSSPISFSIMDARTLNYPPNTTSNCNNNGSGKIVNTQHQPFHVHNQQPPPQQSTPYRHYTNSQNDPEYHHPGRSKSAASTDSAYSSANSTQNGPDCGVVVPRRPSPLQAHSQASPLGHVHSPAYPMYNSPMTTMSSPSPLQQHGDSGNNACANAQTYKATVQQQVTPSSPLDVTVPRPASQGQVAYSSVITRALAPGETNKTYSTENRSYDRQKQQQICWDNEPRPPVNARKFSTYPNNPDMSPQTLANQQPQQSQRQPNYFDSNPMSLQDLSSCRGDPMSVVKNLPQSSSCAVAQQQPVAASIPPPVEPQKHIEDRQRKADGKKRRSFDKTSHNDMTAGTNVMNDYLNRIPPPAHHNPNQPPQNGYFDFERWNLAPPTSKMFPTTTGAFGGQSGLHHTNNFVGNSVHQHQSLMVSHHHVPPPIPYFPAFHLPPGHHPHEFQSAADPSMGGTIGYNDNSGQPQNPNYHQDYNREEQPKVIVPNIEEELGFLQQNHMEFGGAADNQVSRDMKPSCKDPNSGFMTSYLKFLQGERDDSPHFAQRGGRKATWNRSKPYIPPDFNKTNEMSTNGGGGDTTRMLNSVKETPQIDYANDPRYFPLPKERKKPYIDSSDDGITSEDDFPFSLKKSENKKLSAANNNILTNMTNPVMPKPEAKKKGRPIKPGGPTDRKRKAAAAAAAAAAADLAAGRIPKEPEKAPVVLPPRRETSKRKAKEKVSTKQLAENSDDDEQGDSDSDPAWTPAAKLMGEEEEKKKKRGRPVMSKKTKKLLDEDDYSSDIHPKRGRKKSESKNAVSKYCRIDEKLLASVSDEDIDISPFKSGEFVVIKTELDEEFPALWRIDGKTLLQKYEPFNSNGKMLYRNISTYSGWTPQNRHMYLQVPVKFWQQEKLETIVEFLRDEMIIDDRECITRSIKDNEKYQDSFEVYIQTLISQALDSNFLTEIFQEQDEYFLSNVKTIDEVTEERKRRLQSTTKWQTNVVTAISTWPCLNVLKDLPNSECKDKQCVGCEHNKIYARVLLYGQPYNATTLEGSPPDPSVPHEKDFLLCRVCQTKVALFNKVAHQKYLMFLECARRVADKRLADPNKDTTIILNELLADEAWLNQLFKEVRTIWAEIDSIEYQAKSKANAIANANASVTTTSQSTDGTSTVSSVPSLNQLDLPSQEIMNNCLTTDTNDGLSASVS